MKIASILLSMMVFSLSQLFPTVTSSASVDLTDSEIRLKVGHLINAENSIHIQGIEIERDAGHISLEINANLGTCWGKKEYARKFARKALQALYTSDLPLSHVILHVFEQKDNLLTVALGKNQTANMKWENDQPLNAFYEHIKSRTNYKGSPADYCWIIEKNSFTGH